MKAFLAILLLTLTASSAVAQAPVVITNRNNDPVPVKVVNDPAKRAYQVGVDIVFPPTGEYPTVPVGKTFVVEYVNARYRTFNAFGVAPCKLFEQTFNFSNEPGSPLEPYNFIPEVVGTATGASGDVNALSLSEKVSIYIAGGSVLAPNLTLTSTCAAPYVQGRIVFSGYLVNDRN